MQKGGVRNFLQRGDTKGHKGVAIHYFYSNIFIYILKRLTASLAILVKAQSNLCRPRDLSIRGPQGTMSKGLEHIGPQGTTFGLPVTACISSLAVGCYADVLSLRGLRTL